MNKRLFVMGCFVLTFIVYYCSGAELIEQKSLERADLIIFSYDQPLRLYAYIESLKLYVKGLEKIYVLYRARGQAFERSYQIVQKKFPDVVFVKQEHKRADALFKPLLLDILFKKSVSNYVLFGVDDTIVTDFINISECIFALELQKAFGFYLRLGKNITHVGTPTNVLTEVFPEIFAWQFKGKKHAWRLASSIDMTIVHKNDIKKQFHGIRYNTPRQLEKVWNLQICPKSYGLCFSHSKIVKIPSNGIQEDDVTHKFLGFFNQGLKIDIRPLFQVNNERPEINYIPTFIKR